MPVEQVPLTKQDKRLPRTDKANTPEFELFAKDVYEHGSNDESFPGSEHIAGGQEQALDLETVKRFGRKLMGILKSTHSHQTIRIKWVRNLALDSN